MSQYEKLTTQTGETSVPKMKVDLVQKQQDDNWQLDQWGVLGISPKGSFLNYLRSLYSDSETITLAVKHTLSEADSDNDLLRFISQVYMNPDKAKHYEDKNVMGPFNMPEEDDYWTIKGSIKLGDTEFGYSNQKICLSTLGNELFGVIDSLVWCDEIKKIVCDGDTKHCTKTKADMEKAPKITFKLEDHVVEFTQEDYVYFKDDDLQCRFGDICDQRSEGVCGKETQVVLGKLFFEKYTPMFVTDVKTGAASVKFVKDFKAPKERVVVWLIIGIVAALVAVLALVYIIVKKRKELAADVDDSYEQIVDSEKPLEDEEVKDE
jgi:hypothetical protein